MQLINHYATALSCLLIVLASSPALADNDDDENRRKDREIKSYYLNSSHSRTTMSVTPTTVGLAVNESTSVTIQNSNGRVRLDNAKPEVASANLNGSTIAIVGRSPGETTLKVKDRYKTVEVKVSVNSNSASNTNGYTQGRLLASNCFQCHGTNGSGGFDRIIGEDDLLGELQEYLNGEEDPNGIMAAHVKGYTRQQLEDIADYLSVGVR
ncbi:MAG: hypothetical protein Kow0065_06540 [Methylomicrobium sp.]